ncbi:response regulator transcription factor [Saccharopolyspora sp. NFXS83]|uniref:response regulator n=1 Tax=Saccharopolyspora sp. NFXS83 TaxID=2993560 RepID=UPI00224AF9D4|nr:response regulator transcription factor [Saccharopolyspora sp. NFXS83]MCX2731993.1 response regulator transcription factor [Saccharopolyspora sp. NFXS83]
MIRVLIADDEALMRTGIRLILDNAEDVEVVAEAADGPAALHACRNQEIDVALLDVQMPGGDGITAVAGIAREAPRTRSIVLTAFGDDRNVARALRAGAGGFLLKDTGPAELIRAVRQVSGGEPILAPQITRSLIERHLLSPDAAEPARRRLAALTEAEVDVLRQVGAGSSNAEIAQHLHMAVGTVKAHLSRMLAKLDCTNRVQAAILAHDAGLLDS